MITHTFRPPSSCSPAERRTRRTLAARLAFDARDALASRVVELEERVEQLEDRLRWAPSEQELDMWRDMYNELAEKMPYAPATGLTITGEIVMVELPEGLGHA